MFLVERERDAKIEEKVLAKETQEKQRRSGLPKKELTGKEKAEEEQEIQRMLRLDDDKFEKFIADLEKKSK